MSIFNNNVKRLKETYKQINRKVETNHIPLAVGLYTPVITTEKYDYVQFFYHGGGIYTAVTYVIDENPNGLRVTNGRLVELLTEHINTINGKKPLKLDINPFDGSVVCINLRIQSIGTFVVNDDTSIADQLVEGGQRSIIHDSNWVQLIDARHSNQVEEFGQWYSPTSQFIEILIPPQGDFVATRINAYRNESNGQLNPTPEDIVQAMMKKNLPNIQRQLFYEVIVPCLN